MTYNSVKKAVNDLVNHKTCICHKNKVHKMISMAYADYLVKGNVEMAKKTIALRAELLHL
ncbi:MAG: hypothetical protein II453_11050 [Alphaproteobacteria bacterium]|nr:hypothetical protein [Alphaproteobacteria bacterium]